MRDPLVLVLAGLGPLLAASNTLSSGLALGLASFGVLFASNVLAAVLYPWIPARMRAAAFMLLIGALVTAVDLLVQARWFDMYMNVGLFIPLVVANGLILGRAETVAHGVKQALVDGLRYGGLSILALATVGALREVLAPGLPLMAQAAGTLFLLAALTGLWQAWQGRKAPE